MNILFFLIPKKEVEYVLDTFTIRQVIEKMEFHHYSAVPVIDANGKYVSVISSEDLLFTLKDNHIDWEQTMKTPVSAVKITREIYPMTIDKSGKELIDTILNQNFVPVVDDQQNFIGIVTRHSVLNYYQNKNKN